MPESLYNNDHILPRGIVCDNCNNYFSREVEKPFLDSPAISRLRFTQAIPNKRGRIPAIETLLLPNFPVTAYRNKENPHDISLDLSPNALKHITKNPTSTLLLPLTANPPTDRVVSRFLAKMAVEAMALRLLQHLEGISYLIDEPQLDPIRNFARRGQPQHWPSHSRRIYSAERTRFDPDGVSYQKVHEFDFLVTSTQEWYFVFVLFGLELTINLGGPDISGYIEWLESNNGQSPLYSGKNAE